MQLIEAAELLWKRFYFLSAFILIPAIQCFNIMPGNPNQIKLNLALSLDSGLFPGMPSMRRGGLPGFPAGMTYRLFNLLQHFSHHSMD